MCCTVTTREVINGKSVDAWTWSSPITLARGFLPGLCVAHHAGQRRTSAAWERYQNDHDLHALIAAVAGTYATDPNYARIATLIAGQSNVDNAIREARNTPQTTEGA